MNREPDSKNLGKVVSVRGSVVDIQFDAHLPPIYSLLHARKGEIVIEVLAQLDGHRVRGIALTPTQGLARGMAVEDTGRVMDVAMGDGLLGRVIDPLGRPLDDKGSVASRERLPIERPAAPIMDRAPVTVLLQTGLKVVDALIPIGRGQRELILGDRQTGKTAIALDTILNVAFVLVIASDLYVFRHRHFDRDHDAPYSTQ